MNRRAVNDGDGNTNYNINSPRNIIMNGVTSIKPLESTDLMSVTSTPKNFDDNASNDRTASNTNAIARDNELNLDDVNLMTRTDVNELNLTNKNDNTDAKRKSLKPVNYAAKKTVAQGMMDIALITSNANQLKNLIEYQSPSASYYVILIMILLSLLLQVSVGVFLIFKGRFDSKGKDKAAAARVNKYIMSGVFMITIINIFIAVFSTGGRPATMITTKTT